MKPWLRQVRALAGLAVLELYRRKDLIVVGVLTLLILCPLAFLTPFGVPGASRFLNELAMLLIWLFSTAIALGVSARLFPPAFENRTLFPLLAKPVTRSTLVFGKYLGAVAASLSALTLFYLAYALLSGLRQGLWFPTVMIQAFMLHIGYVLIVTALGLLGSMILTPPANLTIGGIVAVGMVIYGQRLPALAAGQPAPVRWIITAIQAVGPHLEFFDLRQRVVHAWPPISWAVCLAVLAYALVYVVFCLMAAVARFRRKSL